jgi:hypothetical protein
MVDTAVANADGWRTFTTFGSAEELKAVPRMTMCPASKEAGFRLTCATCGGQSACNGRRDLTDKRANVGIVVHGNQNVKKIATAANKSAEGVS